MQRVAHRKATAAIAFLLTPAAPEVPIWSMLRKGFDGTLKKITTSFEGGYFQGEYCACSVVLGARGVIERGGVPRTPLGAGGDRGARNPRTAGLLCSSTWLELAILKSNRFRNGHQRARAANIGYITR